MISSLPTSSLAKYLSERLPLGWESYELETILMDLGIGYTDLLADKIQVIKIMKAMPEIFYEDVMFFLHACDVFNGSSADFEYLPSLNSLEMALGIVEASKVSGCVSVETSPAFGAGVREVVKLILIDDGYSSVVWPFDSVGVTGLTPGAFPSDMAKKETAIKEYINGYYNKQKEQL